jgi:hypothetical protein
MKNFCIEFHTNRSSNVGSVGRIYMYSLKYSTIEIYPIFTKHMHARQNIVKNTYSEFYKNILKF